MNIIDTITPNQHPISMSQEHKEKWLTALRSGEFKQATGTLYKESLDGYCCLGVLQKVIGGDVTRHSCGSPAGTPCEDWLAENGIEFLNLDGQPTSNPVLKMNEIRHGSPLVGRELTSIAEINDCGATFGQIADLLDTIITVR